MMTTAQTANRLVRDTTMCGDPKIWFPMRVTYSREMKKALKGYSDSVEEVRKLLRENMKHLYG